MAQAIGSETIELFQQQGDGHVAVLRHHGLADGMAVYDLGCRSGRTAQALQRSGWSGHYTGTDVVRSLVDNVKATCPGYDAFVHRRLDILAADETLDMIFHWSVFTHLFPEECYLYLQVSFRALKPGGRVVFSFLDLNDRAHWRVFDTRVHAFRRGHALPHLDTFLHRDWIAAWAERLGFADVRFTAGSDASDHPPFWQSLVTMVKPG